MNELRAAIAPLRHLWAALEAGRGGGRPKAARHPRINLAPRPTTAGSLAFMRPAGAGGLERLEIVNLAF